MMYWSFLVYDYEERPEHLYTPETALLLYDLEHFECLWEKSLDTKAIVGWNSDTVRVGRGVVEKSSMWRVCRWESAF
jgi:hypothetical protein